MRSIAVGIAFLFLAGCMGGSESTSTSPTTTVTTAPVVAAFTANNDAKGCYEAVGILLIDLDAAQASLPKNWTAADAQVALKTPQPTGKGAVWFNGHTCSNATIAGGPAGGAEFGVLVQPPHLSQNSTEGPATFSVYEVFQASDSAAERAVLDRIGFPSRQANVTVVRNTPLGSAESGSVTVGNSSATFYSFDFAAFLPATFNGTADFWHELPDGLAGYRYAIDHRAVVQGAIGACNFPDPQVQKVTGMPSCGPSSQAFVLVIAQQEWTSEFRWLPRVHAVAV